MPNDDPPPPAVGPVPSTPARARTHLGRAAYLALGLVFLALGIIGAFLPVMPTTIFLILAAWCFGRSSPRLEAWLLDHPRFGATLRAWRAEGAIPRRAKGYALGGMALGFALFCWGAHPRWWVTVLVAGFFAACAAFVVSRPAPSGGRVA